MPKSLMCALLAIAIALASMPSAAFVSKIRSAGPDKVQCHQIAGLYRAYVEGRLTGPQARTRLELFTGELTGADLTDLSAFAGVLDATTVPDIGATAPAQAMEALILQLEKLRKVDDLEKWCGLLELGDDARLSQTEFRNYIEIP